MAKGKRKGSARIVCLSSRGNDPPLYISLRLSLSLYPSLYPLILPLGVSTVPLSLSFRLSFLLESGRLRDVPYSPLF
jgi:hypothetical protein